MPNTYGKFATLAFTNNLNQLIEIAIAQLNYNGPVYALEADDDCLNIKSTTGDEDKMNPLCGSEATIKFRIAPGSPVDITSFIAPQDNYNLVTVYVDKNYVQPEFQGYIVVEDNNQPFLDPPFSVSIKATDSIGTLQGIYFLDTNGNPFQGKQTIIGWLAQILNQTGQTLNLRTYFNIYNSYFTAGVNPLEQICLDATTFQTGQQTPVGDTNPADYNTGFDDYYTVLEKIVRNFRCKLVQEAGYWHLVNMWDYLNPNGMTYFEYQFGAPVNGIVPYTLVNKVSPALGVSIGKNNSIRLVNEDAVLYLKLANKSVELTYNYNQSINKIQNQDLGQGVAQPAQNEVISSGVIDTSYNHGTAVNLNTDAFTDAYYTNMVCTLGGPGSTLQPSNGTPLAAANAFIRVCYDLLGNEMVRFLVLKIAASPHSNYVVASTVLLDVNDILQITFSWRTRSATSIANGTWSLCVCLLTGDDGTFWALNCLENGTLTGNPAVWVQVNSDFQNSFGNVPSTSSTPIPSTLQWSQISINTQTLAGVPYAQAPVSGSLQILLNTDPGPGTEFWFKDISVKILPYLNGSYQQLQGDYNYAESNANILATTLATVDISDSPKRYFQGALLNNGSGYVLLTASWFRAGFTEAMRFTQLMAWLYYSNIYRIVQKIEGSVQRFTFLDGTSYSPIGMSTVGIRNVYYFADSANPTKKYMLCSYDRNYNTGVWRGVFVELNSDQTDSGLKTPDFYEFSYLYTGL
jgi:hypothetical protein